MKTRFLILIVALGFTSFLNAQEIAENAIGLRLGDANGLGASITYQRAILESNRMELNLGWSSDRDYSGIKAVGLFQWVKPIQGDFNWYFGAGAGFASYKFDKYDNHKDAFVFAAGDIGVEYTFDFPLLLSLDLRPELGFGDGAYNNNNLDIDVGISARYTF
ncbi:hypothetical protein Q4512_13980 [Oceanihabitans sp. 2_MG-2023]|uniref:hypothetical protein n=1 Tax=Oceanihabitans sp. 2_MG-2023 TaxID=3062661 RepID=UPI0026E48165|nr:hypothetical protein [Oceanihabitans sp. 2_MG-2023]MDO6598027.1 hypothetical protein [Oceanihabitans sp. 2_MG-2023]